MRNAKRILVLSDSHGYPLNTLLMKAESLGKIDAVFHLGDGFRDMDGFLTEFPFVFCVAGNCDMFSKLPRMARAAYGPHHILAVHGHLQDVKYSYDKLSYYAEDQRCGIALFGHTHVPYAGYEGGVLLMNPGALMDGRYGELVLDGERAVPYLKSFRDESGD